VSNLAIGHAKRWFQAALAARRIRLLLPLLSLFPRRLRRRMLGCWSSTAAGFACAYRGSGRLCCPDSGAWRDGRAASWRAASASPAALLLLLLLLLLLPLVLLVCLCGL
jgi:hypothetical protein